MAEGVDGTVIDEPSDSVQSMDIEEGGGNLQGARAAANYNNLLHRHAADHNNLLRRQAAYYNSFLRRHVENYINLLQQALTTIRNSTAERDELSQIQETAFKIGAWATGISIAGFISVVTGPFGSFQAAAATSSSPTQKKLILASLLSMLASCVSGGALLIVGAVLCRGVALSLPVPYIKALIAVAVASMAIVVCTGLALKLSAI